MSTIDHISKKNDIVIEENFKIVYGNNCLINGNNCVVYGENCMVNRHNCIVYGENCVVNGHNCIVYGNNCVVNGHNCNIYGNECIIYAKKCRIFGENNKSLQMGRFDNGKNIKLNKVVIIQRCIGCDIHVVEQYKKFGHHDKVNIYCKWCKDKRRKVNEY